MIHNRLEFSVHHSETECGDRYGSGMYIITDQLRAFRESRRLTQDAVADDLNWSQGSISRHEAGKIRLPKLVDLADYYGDDVVAVPNEAAGLARDLFVMLDQLDEAQVADFHALVQGFASAPVWARSAALSVLTNASDQVVAKGA